jgi:hypothetical protein
MSTENVISVPRAISPSNSASSATQSDESNHCALYRSLEECLKHPSCVSNTWLDTIADVNNPRALNHAPYKDGSLHWVDKNNQLLNMAFPAVVDLDGKFSKIGPYFNHMGEHEARARFLAAFFFPQRLLMLCHRNRLSPVSQKPKQSFNCHLYRFFPPKNFQPRL